MTEATTIETLKALSKTRKGATILKASQISHVNRNATARTLKILEEFGLVSRTSRGRSEIFAPTEFASNYLSIVSENYGDIAQKLGEINKRLETSPYDLLVGEPPLRESISDLSETQSLMTALKEFTTPLEKSGVRVTLMNPEQRAAVKELKEWSFAFQLATRQLKEGSPEWKVAKEVSQVLDLAHSRVAYPKAEGLLPALPATSLRLGLIAAKRILETASDIVKYARELGLGPVDIEQVGLDGRGRPIYRVK